MPEGDLIAIDRELREPPGEARALLTGNLTPALGRAKYNLDGQTPEGLTFSRRYLPKNALVACLVVIGLVLFTQAGAANPSSNAGPIVVGWVAIGVLIFYRRRETLSLMVAPTPTGSRVVVAGRATKQARQMIDTVIADPSGTRVVGPSLAR